MERNKKCIVSNNLKSEKEVNFLTQRVAENLYMLVDGTEDDEKRVKKLGESK